MFLVERKIKANVDPDALRGTKLENLRIRVDETGSHLVVLIVANSREQAEAIATEILGE